MTSSLGWFLLMSVLVIAGAYASLRFMGNWQLRQGRSRRLRVLEGVPIGRDRHLLLVAVGKEVLVLGSSPNGVSLVHQVSEADSQAFLADPEPSQPVAPSVLNQFPGLEKSIQESLTKMRGLLRKDPNDRGWGPL